ncbi:RluA family pseudouridine synthase [Natronogracilivirga saccharolytica]|uniref:RluA family pseudouridine synthase n=1 Tax=Natronogracilivirga saccharolytica TaxID=2812953 RepID=A0A8J7S9D6_9BACT|nr:RluA family pseudouridine synthase [Natronogracilivirga saccharolytica]MBP3192803.1 RluA family pseudouridine synthase [Natronogracilivirga saccharolytica]
MKSKKKHVRLTPRIRAEILYEDKDVIAVNKPAGILTVPIPGMKSANLQERLDDYLRKQKKQAWTVHRIDRFTSGIVLFAKNPRARKDLIRQFRNHEPGRIYLALIRGVPDPPEGELVHHMKRIKEGFRNVIVPKSDPKASEARLKYRVTERFKNTSLVEVALVTGLKNQIRVQFAEVGHPTVGDRHYASDEQEEKLIDRQALHASRLEFVHPGTKETVVITAPWPKDFQRLIVYYRKS